METSKNFKIISDFIPSGDQPEAIKKLSEGLSKNDEPSFTWSNRSGKTFTMAKTIEKLQRPALF